MNKRIFVGALATLAVIAMVLIPAIQVFAAPEFADEAFERVWNRQDRAVFENFSDRSWTWGPENISPGLDEEYAEGIGGEREVQYFDKSRMEINDPTADPTGRFYVTNGLLPIELMTGRMQVGNNSFEQRNRAEISAIGDPGNFPTYADLSILFDRNGSILAEQAIGSPVTSFLNGDGTVSSDFTTYDNDPATVLLEGGSGYGVPRAFVDFQNQSGLVFENNQYINSQVFDPLFVFGLPVSAPYWVNTTVGGAEVPVMFQIFERRILTYNPANPPSFRVEMGNVGRHYYEWRYGADALNNGEPTEDPTEEPTEDPYPAP